MLELSVEHPASVFTLEGEDERESLKSGGCLKVSLRFRVLGAIQV